MAEELGNNSGVPKDLKVKIGTPLEALWTRVRDARKQTIKDLEDTLILEKAFLKLAEQKVKESK